MTTEIRMDKTDLDRRTAAAKASRAIAEERDEIERGAAEAADA
jgi:hypothetical protein